MPQSDMSGSITYKQEKFIEKLIGEGKEGTSPLFDDIANKRTELKDLSAAQASDLIGELTPKSEGDLALSDSISKESVGDASSHTPPPMTSEQAKYLLDLLSTKSLAVDGQIDVEHLMSRLNTSTASSLIEALKYMPKLDAA